MLWLVTLAVLGYTQYAQCAFNNANCYDGRSVIVHLFNWKHSDVAAECERWLGPKGFCGVQVTPPNEHRVVTSGNAAENRPWWERYQPVSYQLESRTGSRSAFIDMVNRCEAQRVRIYVDMVVNHMVGIDGSSGTGSGGSSYNTATLSFPGVPYGSNDFNCCTNSNSGNCASGAKCYTGDCGIGNYNNEQEVRDCRLVGLGDLAVHLDYVKGKIRGFFDDLINIGVAGFRVDACKHMWPNHLVALYEGMTLPDGSDPFIFNEVIDLGGEPITGDEYYSVGLGRITEFKYCNHVADCFRGYTPLKNLKNFGEAWGMYPSQYALAFVDNHDNQRGHGAGGTNILTFWEPRPYKMAVIFAQAWPYGHVRIMSSYRWPGGRNTNDAYGPPTNNGNDIKTVVIKADGSCDDGTSHTWVCEHRWRQIANMALWRNVAGGETWNTHNWWDNGNSMIAFGRNNKAFIAFNNEAGDMKVTLQTGLPAGQYCDVNSGNHQGGSCTGKVVTVNNDGTAYFDISGSSSDPVIAIHTSAKL